MPAPQRPNADQYPLSFLYLYPRLTRAELFAATGRDAPAFKVTEPIKRFVVPDGDLPATGPFRYRYVDTVTGEIKAGQLTLAEAKSLNLPGLVTYPKYVIAPTGAIANVDVNGSIVRQRINPGYLSLKEDAQRLASELSAGEPVESFLSSGSIDWPEDEQRRPFSITLANGRASNAGLLLKERHKAGVWAPGRWNDPSTNPQWLAEPQVAVETNLLPEVPMPIRNLFPDEVITRAGWQGDWVVQKRKLATKLEDTDKMPERIREIHEKLIGQAGGDLLLPG